MSRKKLTPAQIRECFTAQGAAIAAMVEFAKDQWSGYKPTKKQTEEVNHYIEVLHGDSLKYARTPEDVYFWREVVTQCRIRLQRLFGRRGMAESPGCFE